MIIGRHILQGICSSMEDWSLSLSLSLSLLQNIPVCMAKTVVFPLWNLRRLNLIIAMILVCARFHSAVSSRISKPQTKYCMDFRSKVMWSNHSFNHFCPSTVQYSVLLSICKASNFIRIFNWRTKLLNGKDRETRKRN